jgi:hypothetical protein
MLPAIWNLARRTARFAAGLAARSPIDTLDATRIGEPRIYRSGLERVTRLELASGRVQIVVMRLGILAFRRIRAALANLQNFRKYPKPMHRPISQ